MPLNYQLLPFSLCFALVSAAENNTNHDELIRGWVAAPDGRGTIDILWSCLFTIFICTWTIFHPDIPKPYESQWHQILWKVKVKVMVIFVPELVFAIAISEYFDARKARDALQRLGMKQCDLTHGFFLCMGGFKVISPSGETIQLKYNLNSLLDHPNQYETQSSDVPSDGSVARSNQPSWMNQLKETTSNDIDAFTKSDFLTKGLACIQSLWLFTQVCSRPFQHLAVSNLELSTVAYVFCCLATYILWWRKPQDCTGRISLQCETVEEFDYLDEIGGEVKLPGSANDDFTWLNIVVFLVALMFGGIHCIAWNFHYLTDIERLLWRVSALVTMGIPVAILPLTIRSANSKFAEYAVKFFWGIYVFVRIYIIFEAFFSLRAGPASLYKRVEWSSYVPHI